MLFRLRNKSKFNGFCLPPSSRRALVSYSLRCTNAHSKCDLLHFLRNFCVFSVVRNGLIVVLKAVRSLVIKLKQCALKLQRAVIGFKIFVCAHTLYANIPSNNLVLFACTRLNRCITFQFDVSVRYVAFFMSRFYSNF